MVSKFCLPQYVYECKSITNDALSTLNIDLRLLFVLTPHIHISWVYYDTETKLKNKTAAIQGTVWGLCHQKQVCGVWISNYISQFSVKYNYLCLTYVPGVGVGVGGGWGGGGWGGGCGGGGVVGGGGRYLNINSKMSYYQYRNSHYKDISLNTYLYN